MNRLKVAALLTLAVITTAIGIYYSAGQNAAVAVAGVVDVEKTLSPDSVVTLDGTWDFYWNQLLEPDAIGRNTVGAAHHIRVPGGWSSIPEIPAQGCGTYRLHLINLNPAKEYGLLKKNIRIASKVFVDGKLLLQDGTPSNDSSEEVMGNAPRLLHFVPQDTSADIVIQVSNFRYYSGGIVESIRFGLLEDVEHSQKLQMLFETVILTYLMIISITLGILVVFFPVFRNEKAGSFYMPWTVLAFAVINGSLGERLIKLLFGNIPTDLLIRIEYIAIGVLMVTLTITVHLMDRLLLSKPFTRAVVGIYLVLTAAVIVTDMNHPMIWNLFTLTTLLILPAELLMVGYRYLHRRGMTADLEEHTLMLFILYLVNVYNFDVLMFTLGKKSSLNLAILSAGVFGFVWFMLIIYRYSLTERRNREISTALMESYYHIEKNASEARRNEIAFLQAQIKPHFLFNSLSGIISLCGSNPKRAQSMIENMANYLKGLFDVDPSLEHIELGNELGLVTAYTNIEKERFGSRLQVEFVIDERALKMRIAPLLIQPLVENAMHHGALKQEMQGRVRLAISIEADELLVVVDDNGPGFSERAAASFSGDVVQGERRGVGVKNVKARLWYYYNRQLHLETNSMGGARLWFKIPIDAEGKDS